MRNPAPGHRFPELAAGRFPTLGLMTGPPRDLMRSEIARKAAEDSVRRSSRRKTIPRSEGFMVEEGLRSRDRIQTIAEVFTAEREVKAMLDLLGEVGFSIEKRFLEPACGNGNFLEEIAVRKLASATSLARSQDKFEFLSVLAFTSIYGIDISLDNVEQARERMKAIAIHAYSTVHNTWKPSPAFYDTIDYVLKVNVILGDTLNRPDRIELIEFSSPTPGKLSRRFFTLDEIMRRSQGEIPRSFKMIGASHFLDLL